MDERVWHLHHGTDIAKRGPRAGHPAVQEAYKAPKKEHSSYVSDHFLDRVLFGDTHLHSSWSSDAGMLGATLGPDEAYRVSRGEEVRSHLGYRVKLKRPLDYIVLADHA